MTRIIVFVVVLMASAILPARSAKHGAEAVLNIANYTKTFDSNFPAGLCVSQSGPSTSGCWLSTTPYNGNFGNIGFTDVFATSAAGLSIKTYNNAGTWHAGILASVDPSGNGFSQQWGYFEMKAQIPAALGSNWPAFWLLSQPPLVTPTIPSVEIDIIEQFGNFFPNLDNFTYHYYTVSPPPTDIGFQFNAGTMSDAYYTYGVDIEPDRITWYFNRVAIGSIATPPEAATPFYILVDLALSAVPPDSNTISPTFFNVAYIQAYSKNP